MIFVVAILVCIVVLMYADSRGNETLFIRTYYVVTGLVFVGTIFLLVGAV